METKLSDLTVSEFIGLVCGEWESFYLKSRVISPLDKATAIRNVILEYKGIVDPIGLKSHLLKAEELIKARMEETLWTMADNLMKLKEHDRVAGILREAGARVSDRTRMEAEVRSRLAKARRVKKDIGAEIDTEMPDPDSIRRQFDEQTASLMAWFKFQIDPSVMKASLYAHLIARHNREIKAKMAAMKR